MHSKFARAIGLFAVAIALAGPSAERLLACADPLPLPPLWVLDDGLNGNGNQEFLIGVELAGLFTDITPGETACACGLQFSSPLPFGSSVKNAFVAVTNRQTHAMTPVAGFDFQPNPNTTEALQGFTESFNWFGLATEAFNTITPPVIGPGDALKLWYRVEILDIPVDTATADVAAGTAPFDPAEAFSVDNLRFAAGGADADGNPIPPGLPHGIHLFEAVVVPEPASGLLVLTIAVAAVTRRRRSIG